MYATPLSRLCAAYVTALSRVFKEAAESRCIGVVKGAKRWEILALDIFSQKSRLEIWLNKEYPTYSGPALWRKDGTSNHCPGYFTRPFTVTN
jgi:hypothetical protein